MFRVFTGGEVRTVVRRLSQEQGSRPGTTDLESQLLGAWEGEVGGPELGAGLGYTVRTCFCF